MGRWIVLAFLGLGLSCIGKDDTGLDTDADADADADTDADADADPVWSVIGWEGAATVEPGATYVGYERYYVRGVEEGQVFCLWEWEITQVRSFDGCSACAWAFEVRGSNGHYVEGTCDRALQVELGPYIYGFAPAYGDYGDVLFFGTGPSSLYYVAPAAFDGVNFGYDWAHQYVYY